MVVTRPRAGVLLAPAHRRHLRRRDAEHHQIVAYFLRPPGADRQRMVAGVAAVGMALDPDHNVGMLPDPARLRDQYRSRLGGELVEPSGK